MKILSDTHFSASNLQQECGDFENTEVTEWHKRAVLEGKTEFSKCNLLKFLKFFFFVFFILFLAQWIRTAKDSK